MSEKRTSFIASLAAAVLGMGLAYFITKYRASFSRFFNKTTYKPFDILHSPEVVVVNTVDECKTAVQKLQEHTVNFRALGFDCEWVTLNGKRRSVALLQLASKNGFCALIRLCHLAHIPSDLKVLLEDYSILKVGVAPTDDARYLLSDYGIIVRGCLDLRHLTDAGKRGGLGALSETILGVKLDKNWRIRCSDWEAEDLSEQQKQYAAGDALVAVGVFSCLINKQRSYYHKWLQRRWSSEPSWPEILNQCQCYLDTKYKQKTGRQSAGDAPSFRENAAALSNSNKPGKPFSRAYSTLKKPFYDNCYLQAPDGEVLCTSSERKLKWYVTKDLGTVVSDNPFTVRLKFEPAGRAVGDVGQYYTTMKDNCCVACGKTDTITRKNIVPHEYRRYFPGVMKDHTSHDVLLLCCACHHLSNMLDQSFRQKLADLCDAPISKFDDVKVYNVPSLKKVRSAGRALKSPDASKIPQQRHEELKHIILEHFKADTITDELLDKAENIATSVLNHNYEPHGQRVVQYFSVEGDGLTTLERMWREHFIKTMQPRFLPPLWSVSHNHARLEIRASQNRVLPEELLVAGVDAQIHVIQ